jgi:REP element-mobilizing transposase RayT
MTKMSKTNFNPLIHHRRSIRLKGYDYSSQGAYFITICVNNMRCLFGKITSCGEKWGEHIGSPLLNDAGCMVRKWYFALAEKFTGIEPREYVIMPNHFHAIIINAPSACPPTSVPRVVQWFKTMSTNEYIRSVKALGWAPFEKRLWQRNYYEHIIRDDHDYRRIAEYIITNPTRVRADQRVRPPSSAPDK